MTTRARASSVLVHKIMRGEGTGRRDSTRRRVFSSPSPFHPVKRFDVWLLDTFRQRLRASKLVRPPRRVFHSSSPLSLGRSIVISPRFFFFKRSDENIRMKKDIVREREREFETCWRGTGRGKSGRI